VMAAKSYYDCVGIIQKAAGGVITEKQAKEILDEIDALAESKKNSGGMAAMEQLVLDDLDRVTGAIRESALIEKRNALINAQKLSDALAFVRKWDMPGEGLRAYLVGSVHGKRGARLSIDARAQFLRAKYTGRMIHDLEKEGLLELLASGDMDRDIAKELWELPNGNKGVTKNVQATKIAEIINRYQNDLVGRQNRAGAFIQLMPGYVVRQSHDMIKLRAAGFEAWRDAILPWLDPKTFGTMKPNEFLKEAYQGLVTGMHYKAKGEASADKITYLLGFKGPSNLARKMSEERVLHFKDSDAWFDYNQQFGPAALREAVVFGFEHGARNLALMEGLGTNPLAMLDRVISTLKSDNKADLKKFDSLKDTAFHNMYRELDGTTKIPYNLSTARIGRGIRLVQNMSKLGAAVISSITDIPFQAAELRYQGVGVFERWLNPIQNVLRGRGKGEQRDIARLLGVGFDGILGDVMSRFSSDDHIGGTMAKLQQRFFKLNLMNWWNDTHKTGVGLIMSNHMAELAPNAYGKLPPDEQRLLSLFDISEKDWDLVRSTVYEADGTKYLTPDKVQDLDDELVKKTLGLTQDENPSVTARKVRKYKDDLETKFGTMFTDRANSAIPMPGAAEHAMMNMGTQPGTALGEALRLFMQFKSFPISAIRKGIGREVYGYGADTFKEAVLKGKGDMIGLAQLIVSTTIFGYLAMAMKDLLKGRTPRDPTDPKTVAAAMAQGGGMGIYGDFIFGEFSRYGRSAVATLAGPTFGQIDDIAEIWTRLRRGEDFGANAMRLAINNTPFINLFYTRTALDYLILYQLQESVNPGFLHRLEGRIMRENEQRFLLPPSSVVPYGG
jgi:hypothetical protein